jgi:3'-5' exonuclease
MILFKKEKNMALSDILFLDLETASQYRSFNDLPEIFKKLWERQVFQSYKDLLSNKGTASIDDLSRIYLEKAALHAEFCKIICASIGRFVFETEKSEPVFKVKAICGEELNILSIVSKVMITEQSESVKNPIKHVCAHNGKKFDFPVFARRCIINGLPVPKILDVRDLKPWENVNIDTQDLWRFGDMVFPSLEIMCTCLNIPVKTCFDGSMVHDAFYNGDIKSIASYCNEDVIAMAKMYVKIKSGLDVTKVEVF